MNLNNLVQQFLKMPNKAPLLNKLFGNNTQANLLAQQLMRAPDKMAMLKNFANSNPRANQILSQLELLNPQERENALNNMLNGLGISSEQINNLFK